MHENLCHRFIHIVLLTASILILAVLRVAASEGPGHASEALEKPELSLLVDPTRALSLTDILALDETMAFRRIRGDSINLGYSTDAAWLRMQISSVDDRMVLLSMTPNFVDLLDIYVGTKAPGLSESDFRHREMGDNRPIAADDMPGLNNVVPIELRAGVTTVVYIRAAAVNSNLSLTAALYSPASYGLYTAVSGLVYGIWFGGMAVLLTIQLVFYHFDRKPQYVLLALATFVAMLVYTGVLGYSRLFLFPHGGIGNDIFTAATSWAGVTASTLAGASILEIPRTSPRLNRLFMVCAGLGLVGVAFAANSANFAFAATGSIVIVVVSTAGAIHALLTANEDGVGTRLRAAAFVAIWLGLTATMAQRSGIVALPTWVAHSYAVSCVVQTILLTGALGVRLRVAEAKNRLMQAEALAIAKFAGHRANILVAEKTAELAHAKAIAEDSLRAELASQEQQVRFMEVLGHQYRTPLAAIRSHVDAMSLSLPAADEGNRRRIERIRLGIVRLVEVLEINLTRSRVQGSSFRPMMARIAVSEIVGNAATRARDLLQRQIEVTVDPASQDTYIVADSDMLGIAIINLLENAAKFSALREKSTIHMKCAVTDAHVAVSVRDEGVGIAPDEIAAIVEHSVRGSNSMNVPGSGLGLSLVRRIVSAHGATMEIASVPGAGTTVKIILPTSSG